MKGVIQQVKLAALNHKTDSNARSLILTLLTSANADTSCHTYSTIFVLELQGRF